MLETVKAIIQSKDLWIILLCIVAIILIIRWLIRQIFCIIYHLDGKDIRGTRIIPYIKAKEPFVRLRYPVWLYATKDGTMDRRRKGNKIIWGKSVLRVGSWKITTKQPGSMINTMNAVRRHNEDIWFSPEEERAMNQRVATKQRQMAGLRGAQDIFEMFKDHPFDFEDFVADLYERMGYYTELTSRTADGGYDIYVEKDGISGIVECKCYDQKHKISRPLLQKLVGANEAVGAVDLFFVTTSDYSAEALRYAKAVGIKAMNGQNLARAVSRYMGDDIIYSQEHFDDYYFLTLEDVAQHFPSDIATR